MGIERDILFEATFPLSVSAEAAHRIGGIMEGIRLLAEATAPFQGGP